MKKLIITIFGSTGDLTSRKLLPALSKLFVEKQIPEETLIIALGRKEYDTDSYLKQMKHNSASDLDSDILKKLVKYLKLDITDLKQYKPLVDLIQEHKDSKTRELYYLAIGPELFPIVSTNINASSLVEMGNKNQSIIFEKPFGHDLKSAKEINEMLWSCFDEKQIYRIDHYLGKEMIQNIMMVRFANRIFEDIWHNRTIKNVKIIAKETDGVLGRAGYYDTSGALKDMVQSHLLQMLSLIAMDVPLSYFSEDVKNEKVQVLKHLSFDKDLMLCGQYDGYLEEDNIPNDSKTETFVFLKTFVNTPRFKGVPFYLMTGKKLDQKESVIIIEFEETNEQRKWDLPLSTNKLYIKIAPLDGVGLILNSKVPGLRDDVETVELEYCIACNAVGNMSEAYEKLLLDIHNHHKTLFTRWDEIEYAWHFIEQVDKDKKDPIKYKNFEALEEEILNMTGEKMK
ncbi:glucose-6-phosphate dehydrogenase [Peloplasma aerotolerans]|uniref:Glucose-6-phosphate 1-dehydrogenase n=1 Tax=Peloplasma aerotolerans TaxID=3044389 RepID=A0AAW6U9Z7_9MOLU|nr:glucose-6-phosphate dehydrogenase [Mariniplasma sp. M4Ah]MDI6452988.1 glucose-6-phosphate dehydrogenase [Mariniplasma sp. M4Ah]